MAYNEFDNGMTPNRQRDLVLSINEFCFLQNKTNGTIKSHVGPLTMTISQQESLVNFNSKTKKFEEVSNFEDAKQLFVSAPEGWYIVLKNPTGNGSHPEPNKANITPDDMKIGTKVNIAGPTSFALYPGQMAKVIRGHKLRSNQYLIARVYDAEAAMSNSKTGTIINAEGKEIESKTQKYFVGQLLIIKGTEISFYIPPTGVEVVPSESGEYIRDAVTLERLEYAILKDEDGEKRYVHGPAVVFPAPTETFVLSSKGNCIFKAIELSPISGIYIKVIAPYTDEKGVEHSLGEEMFITGNDQMIYYPRPEHTMISYDGKIIHHAIAIPKGEGRYILNRLTGEISTIIGPQMYLPDPRTEVVVLRKLTYKECELYYPNNQDVLNYNLNINEKNVQKAVSRGLPNITTCVLDTTPTTLADVESSAAISRDTSYTKPRTITLDNKYNGVISINIWNNYAVNVVSKTGESEIVEGSITRILDYDEHLEEFDTEKGQEVYKQILNNKIEDGFTVTTSDLVPVTICVEYTVDFMQEFKNKWFSVNNDEKFIKDKCRVLIKKAIKNYSIADIYKDGENIIHSILVPEQKIVFEDNGTCIKEATLLNAQFNDSLKKKFDENQSEIISKNLQLADAEEQLNLTKKLAEYNMNIQDIEYNQNKKDIEYALNLEMEKLNKVSTIEKEKRKEEKDKLTAKQALQKSYEEINNAEIARRKALYEQTHNEEVQRVEIEKEEKINHANMIKSIFESISPDLISALESKSNAEMLSTVTQSMAPYAIAGEESVAETTNKLLRGTSLENVVNAIVKKD